MPSADPLQTPSETLWEWLQEPDPLPAEADAVIGFGHFDLRIPALCAEMVRAGRARHVIFTGGIGAGTGNLGAPEADVFARYLRDRDPAAAARLLLAENRSTNTAENIRFTAEALAASGSGHAFGRTIRSVILIAHAPRLRRVRQTWAHLMPEIPAAAIAPKAAYSEEKRAYEDHGLSLLEQLVGEIERLNAYPRKGWIAAVPIPSAIMEAAAALRAAGSA